MNLVMMSHNLSKFYVQMTCNFFSMVFFTFGGKWDSLHDRRASSCGLKLAPSSPVSSAKEAREPGLHQHA